MSLGQGRQGVVNPKPAQDWGLERTLQMGEALAGRGVTAGGALAGRCAQEGVPRDLSGRRQEDTPAGQVVGVGVKRRSGHGVGAPRPVLWRLSNAHWGVCAF